jgi:hypothetical protein
MDIPEAHLMATEQSCLCHINTRGLRAKAAARGTESVSERKSFYLVSSAKKTLPPVVPVSPKPIKTLEPRQLLDRHAAITDKINGWNDYRRWVQTTRDTWDAENKK